MKDRRSSCLRKVDLAPMQYGKWLSHMTCVVVCKLPSAGDSGGDTESVESSSNDSPPSTQSAVEKKRQEYTDYFHPFK